MAIVIPGTAVNYPNALLAVGLNFNNSPQEGFRSLPAEIDWGTMGGTNKIVSMNAQTSGGTIQLSQICAIHIDNSGCGSDIQFVFTDTQETYTVAAYEPYALFPVFSKSLQFYVVCGINGEVVESQDTTRFSLFNFVPPPVVLPLSVEQNTASVTGIDMGTATTQLVPTGINGTLEDVYLFLGLAASNTGSGTWILEDGAANIIGQGTIQVSSGNKINITLLSLSDVRVRFTNGLKILCSQSASIGGTISGNLYYRTP